jgi:hypothetical protein
MGMSKVAPRGNPEFCGVSVSVARTELSKAVGGIWPAVHKGVKGDGFRSNAREDIKGMSGNGVGKVRDHGNAVLTVGSLVGRGVNRWCSMRKSRGRVKM